MLMVAMPYAADDVARRHLQPKTPGAADGGNNLGGTLASMDCYESPADCVSSFRARLGPGLVSKAGWALVDDTNTARWATTSATATEPSAANFARWFNQGAAPIDAADWYGFFPGRSYSTALKDFATVAGPMDFPPLSAFGIWWSRYWVYSTGVPEVAQDIVKDVLDGYRDNALPLNHLVMDMDWHTWNSQWSVLTCTI